MKTKPTIFIVAALVAIAAVVGSLYSWYSLRPKKADWDTESIKASYVGAQLTETDPQHASLLLSYEITNFSSSDSRLQDGPGFVVMSRLKTDHSLSSQEDVHVSYPTFLPAKQSARIAIELRHQFAWPDDNDPELQKKLRQFVDERLSGIEEFVVFDQPDRYQIEFPSGWQELTADATTAGE